MLTDHSLRGTDGQILKGALNIGEPCHSSLFSITFILDSAFSLRSNTHLWLITHCLSILPYRMPKRKGGRVCTHSQYRRRDR